MNHQVQFSISFPENDKDKIFSVLAPLFNLASTENGRDFSAVRKKEALVVLPRPDNTTTFLPVLKGTTLSFSEDGGVWYVSYDSEVVLELSSKGWISNTPSLKAVSFPILAKDAPKKKTRDEAFAQLKAHSSKLFLTMPNTPALIAEALMSVLPTLKTNFEKDLGYINSAFSLPGFDYLADLSLMGLQPVSFGDTDEDYFLLTRVTESKLSALMKKMEISIPRFASKKGEEMDVKNCFILTMAIVKFLIEKEDFLKDIVVFVDLNSGNLGGTSCIFDCLDFLNGHPVSVQVTRVGSKVQAHFCLRFTKTGDADDSTRSWMETALRAVLAQTYKHLANGTKLVSVTYEKDKELKRLQDRHPLTFSGETALFSVEKETVTVKPKTVGFALGEFDEEEDEEDSVLSIPVSRSNRVCSSVQNQQPETDPVKLVNFQVCEEEENAGVPVAKTKNTQRTQRIPPKQRYD